MNEKSEAIEVEVRHRRALTGDIAEFTLEPVTQRDLPSCEPGAHITVQTPGGAMRRYSVINPGSNPSQYIIAVKRESASRGGSRSMHEQAHPGTRLLIEPPENDFVLGEAPQYLLIAGGIGITPIYAMACQLAGQGKNFSLIYCTRSPAETAYLDEIRQQFGERALVHHDDGDPERVYDFWDHFAEPGKMHVYCCGPKPLIEEIKAISGHWPEGRVRFEDFKPVEIVRPDDSAFSVELTRSGLTVTVPADRSILETLRDAGIRTVSSCESGTCGTCKCRLLDGIADHRDMVLMEEEKDDFIMICVSRARDGKLVLDL
jgi:phthalate 4,5-dioxygenase reductase component